MSKLEDILNGLGASKDLPQEPDPEQVLQFKTNPLAVIMLHTELQSTIEERNYSDVFENDGDYLGYNSEMLKHDYCNDPVYEIGDINRYPFSYICNLATEIITYFREVITLKKIKGIELSPYEKKLSEFLHLVKTNQCKINHLPLACKLPEFYQVEQDFLEMSDNLQSIDENSDDIVQMQTKLTPLHVWKKHIKKEKKDCTFLHFKSENNRLVEYKVRKSDILFELFNSKAFKDITLNTQIYGTLRSHPLSGFTYLIAERIVINS